MVAGDSPFEGRIAIPQLPLYRRAKHQLQGGLSGGDVQVGKDFATRCVNVVVQFPPFVVTQFIRSAPDELEVVSFQF